MENKLLPTKQEVFQVQPPDLLSLFGGVRGYHVTEQTVPGSKLESGAMGSTQIADGAVNSAKLASASVVVSKVSYEVVSVSITAGSTIGTGTCTTGSVIFGFIPVSVDQVIKTISVVGTTVTVTLNAGATGTNQINVILIKA